VPFVCKCSGRARIQLTVFREPLLAHVLAAAPQGSSVFTPGLNLLSISTSVPLASHKITVGSYIGIPISYRFYADFARYTRRVGPACRARNFNSGAFWCVLVPSGVLKSPMPL
jgi:hypothetical protein